MPDKWEQVKALFTSALERDRGERSSFLRQACAGDEDLRAEIESLLSSFDGAATFLEHSPAADLISAHSPAVAGRRIGAYRVIRQCGQGGMGVVYLAERADDEFRKRVAIKMLKPGTEKDEILRRFRNERQALAALDHPGIVRLLDGGSTEDGLPYLIMDYVEGVRIDEYCDAHKFSLTERLDLFCKVCRTVQYAHENLVIHRDLKPSNILITGEGEVRLLDFGIAKVLNPQWSPDATLTRTQSHPLTPEYASPEQLRGETVTTVTDIYSLGVVLYELLSGHRPRRRGQGASPENEWPSFETEPEKPSVAAGRTDDGTPGGATRTVTTPHSIAAARGMRPEELQRSLRGDLDIIVMKAIRSVPRRRYPSAAEFAQDIDRHLAGLPITARRPTFAYRGGKFIRRHAESFTTAALLLALIAGLAVWTAHKLKTRNASEAPAGTVHVRKRPSVAVLSFKDLSGHAQTGWLATALTEILTAELAAGEQLRTVPPETVVRSQIELGLSNVESLPPGKLSEVRRNLDTDFILLGSYLYQAGQIRLDLRLVDTAKGETVATVAETGTENNLIDLAAQVGQRLRQRFGLEKLSQVESEGVRAELPSSPDAMRFYAQGLARIRAFDALTARELLRRSVAADPAFPLAHSALAGVWAALGYDFNARQEARKALDEARSLSREKHLLVEAGLYETNKDWAKAIEADQTLFSFFPDNLEYGLRLANVETASGRGKDALNTLASLATLGSQEMTDPRIDIGRADAAASLGDDKLRRDAAGRAAQKAAEQGARLLVARARCTQCRALANLGENQEAERACAEAQQIYTAAGDRGGLARTLHNMAEVPLNQGDLAGAETLYRRALSITREIGDQQGMGRELVNLGVILKKQGRLPQAQSAYLEAYRLDQQAGDKNAIAIVTGNLGNLSVMQGKLAEAAKYFNTALQVSNEIGHRTSAALALGNMADAFAMEGKLAEASAAQQQALAMWKELGNQGYYAGGLVDLGKVFRQQADLDRAQKSYLEALTIQQQLGLKGDAAATQIALAQLDCDLGNTAEAGNLAREAIKTSHLVADVVNETAAQVILAKILAQQGRPGEAMTALAAARRLSQQNQDVTILMPLELTRAYVLAEENKPAAAESAARQVIAQARRLGFVPMEFEALLASGEIQMRGKDSALGRKRLEQTKKDARTRGLELVARKADARLKASFSMNR